MNTPTTVGAFLWVYNEGRLFIDKENHMTALFYIFEEFARRFGYAITIHYAKDSNVASVVMSKGDGYKYVINICKINK